ncbi:MAG TPA: fatty acid desaturase CarF family protein [Candidatus Baltobacteraceae bacterium]|jgi:ubiquitin-conjugating enzyme E2 variant
MLYIVSSAAIATLWIAACLAIADFISGLLHWAEDTWLAPGKSELLDRWIVRDNIDHHRMPGTIRAGHYWQTNRVCILAAAVVTAALLLFHVHAWQTYFVVLLLSQSNQVHLWAHSSRVPRWVAQLQRAGILQSRNQHAKHHKSPYAINFCTMTDYLNPLLERLAFWRRLESLLVGCGATVVRATPARNGY